MNSTSNFGFNAHEYGSSVIPTTGCNGTNQNTSAANAKYVAVGGRRTRRHRSGRIGRRHRSIRSGRTGRSGRRHRTGHGGRRHRGGSNLSSYSTIGKHTMGSVIGAKAGYSGLETNNEILLGNQRPLNPFSLKKGGRRRRGKRHTRRFRGGNPSFSQGLLKGTSLPSHLSGLANPPPLSAMSNM